MVAGRSLFVGLIALAALINTGCGVVLRGESSYFVSYRHVNVAQALAEANVSCADPTNCSPSVGQILVPGTDYKGGVVECTGFVIRKQFLSGSHDAPTDYVVTNSHCIPLELKPSGSSCAQRIGFKLPSNGLYPTESLRCDKIVFASDISRNGGDADFAIFSLASVSSHPAIEIAREGLTDYEQLQTFSVDPFPDVGTDMHLGGSLVTRDCTVLKDRTFWNNDDDLQTTKRLYGQSCEGTRHGNSGSPVVRSDGKAVAVLHAIYDLRPQPIPANQFVKFVSPDKERLYHGQFHQTQYATNFACVGQIPGLPEFGLPLSNCP